MEELIEKISEELQMDKSKWVLTKFGDVAIQQKQNVDRENTDLTRYVKGEHMGSEDLHLRSWGELKDEYLGPAFIRRFDEGDILYGSRRTYLRKVVVAPFSGITSNTTFVIKANEENIDKRLLPFIMMSEGFTENSIRNSKGSVNPYINWKDIAKYEFLLPPKDQQAQLAKLLWAMDEVIEREKEIFISIDKLFKTKAKYISDNHAHEGQYKKIKEVCIIKDNMRKPLNSSERDKMKGEIPYYGANGLVDYLDDFIFNEELVLVAEDGGNFNEFYSKEIAYRVSGKSWVNNHAHVLVANNELLSTEWLFYSLVHKNILKYIIGTTRLKLNKSELENIRIWVPSEKLIEEMSNEMNEINRNRDIANEKLSSSKSLQKSLINQVF